MNSFLKKHASKVNGVLSGWDRLLLRGILQSLTYVKGMMMYLSGVSVLLRDFGKHVDCVTKQLREASLQQAAQSGRPVLYLPNYHGRKDDLAREIAERDHITEGLVCILKTVEPCNAYNIGRNVKTRYLELQPQIRKCLHLYHYMIHPEFGFMHARPQTWFPFGIQICINGREWLSRQMDKAGIKYERRANCFTDLEDFLAAQKLLDQQPRANWPRLLDAIVDQIHPAHQDIFRAHPLNYYWSAHQSEWATDVTFRSRGELQSIYRHLVRFAITSVSGADVLRYMGRKVNRDGSVPGGFNQEVLSNVKHRPEGVRIKHRVGHNSLKIYDKENNLRFETTMNDPKDFKVYRPKSGDPDGPSDWRPLRKGVADLIRRAEVSQAANNRLMESQAAVSNETALKELVEPLCRPVSVPGRPKANGRDRTKPQRHRGLNPFSTDDAILIKAVCQPEFNHNGLRNRDLRALLYPKPARSSKERRRQAAAVTRKLALLRAHRLIHKVPKTHRYTVSPQGRLAMTALLAAYEANTDQLTKSAA